MKKDLPVFLFLGLITSLVFFKTFSVFFAQDDFILINHFSQNTFLVDLGNAIGAPKVSHWRPVDNLYYLIAGNIFDKNFSGYHIFTFLLHISAAFFVYKLTFKLLGTKSAAFFGSLIYAISPVHFVSLAWISGNATLIAFLFYIISLYLYSEGRKSALIFYLFSLLASEAFFFASITFLAWDYLSVNRFSKKSFVFILAAFTFLIVKILFLTPAATYEIYRLDLSLANVETIKYYLLRIMGFAESSGDLTVSLILVIVILFMFSKLIRNLRRKKTIVIFSLILTAAGLFPFILLQEHNSAHYMNLSLLGFSFLSAAAYLYSGRKTQIALIAAFTILYSYSVNLTYSNSWVVKRSQIAKSYIDKIKADNLDQNSRILFAGDDLNTSEAYFERELSSFQTGEGSRIERERKYHGPQPEEVYYSLGGGEALKFYFKDKNYNVCFEVFENCNALP